MDKATELPEYPAAYAAYRAALNAAATADNPDAARQGVELDWVRKELDLERTMNQRNGQLASIKAQYPKVPEHIYAPQPGGPVNLEAAKAFHEAVTAAGAPQTPPPPANAAASNWGPTTGGGPQGEAPPPKGHPLDDPATILELHKRARESQSREDEHAWLGGIMVGAVREMSAKKRKANG